MGGDGCPYWQSPERRCYGNQLNLGAVRRRRQERPLLFAPAFDNGYDDREATFKRLNGKNPSTSCTNVVSICPIISEFALLKRVILPCFGCNLTTIFIRHFGRFETVRKIAILILE